MQAVAGESTSMTRAADDLSGQLVALRRDLHRLPEAGRQEVRTAARLIDELEALGIDHVYHGIGGGIVAHLPGSDPQGPTIAVRAEMDALPITEATNLPFASQHEGWMHACGHDGHMAMVTGAAILFRDSPPPGNLVVIFQPAEEGGAGARVMVERGALRGVDMIFGGHMTRHYTLGTIMVPSGLVGAQSDHFIFRLRGRGGHGARPHEGSDTIIPASSLILALQSLITRESNPFHPTVISIGCVHAGTAHNAIADYAELEGIIRSTAPDDSKRIMEGMQRIAHSTGEAFHADIEVSFDRHYPPLRNNDHAVDIACKAVRALLGDSALMTRERPSMGAEDFSYYLQEVPGCYVRFGARAADAPDIPLHSPQFDFDENLLPVGARYFDAVVRGAINTLR
jgi:amidohydrolase